MTLIDPSNSSATKTKIVKDLDTRFFNLKKYHMYQLTIDAFTSQGVGPSISTTASTDQDGMSSYHNILIRAVFG